MFLRLTSNKVSNSMKYPVVNSSPSQSFGQSLSMCGHSLTLQDY